MVPKDEGLDQKEKGPPSGRKQDHIQSFKSLMTVVSSLPIQIHRPRISDSLLTPSSGQHLYDKAGALAWTVSTKRLTPELLSGSV